MAPATEEEKSLLLESDALGAGRWERGRMPKEHREAILDAFEVGEMGLSGL